MSSIFAYLPSARPVAIGPMDFRLHCYLVVFLDTLARAVTPPFCIYTTIDLQESELELQTGFGAGLQINDINDLRGAPCMLHDILDGTIA